jgi:hypothetical protein
MGKDEAALLRLWREKRGEVAPEDLSTNLIVQLGNVTEDLNRRWFEANSGQDVVDVQKHVRHPVLRWMGATLDGRVEATAAVFEAKFMLPWSFSEEAALEKYAPQLQPNMWVVAARTAAPPRRRVWADQPQTGSWWVSCVLEKIAANSAQAARTSQGRTQKPCA